MRELAMRQLALVSGGYDDDEDVITVTGTRRPGGSDGGPGYGGGHYGPGQAEAPGANDEGGYYNGGDSEEGGDEEANQRLDAQSVTDEIIVGADLPPADPSSLPDGYRPFIGNAEVGWDGILMQDANGNLELTPEYIQRMSSDPSFAEVVINSLGDFGLIIGGAAAGFAVIGGAAAYAAATTVAGAVGALLSLADRYLNAGD